MKIKIYISSHLLVQRVEVVYMYNIAETSFCNYQLMSDRAKKSGKKCSFCVMDLVKA